MIFNDFFFDKIWKIKTIIYILSLLYIIILFFKRTTEKRIKEAKIIKLENKFIQSINDSEIKKFWEINNNFLINKEKYERTKNPEISIIILIYNQANCIHKCLRSIQNQSLKNIEIIIIDDCSQDNSTEIIEEYKKTDNRIILIKHDSNDGKIKSRSDGIRNARGKYITFIDGDDSFIHQDILMNSLIIANVADLDVTEFKISLYEKHKFINNLNNYIGINDKIFYQPELKKIFLRKEEKDKVRGIVNRNICGKLIRRFLLIKVLFNIGKRFTEDYINNYEDTLMVVYLFKYAKSYYLMKEKGYYYSHDECKNKFNSIKNKKCKINHSIKGIDPIKYLNFLLFKMGEKKLEKILLYREIISIDFYWNMTFSINNHFQLIYNILDKTMKSRFLSSIQKNKIKLIKQRLLNKEKLIQLKNNN